MLEIYVDLAQTMLGAVLLLWVISLFIKRVSFIDTFWGIGFILVAWKAAYLVAPDSTYLGDRQALIMALVTFWGLRLAIHLGLRFIREGEDKRYINLMKRRGKIPAPIFSLLFIFLFQGAFILIIASPIVATLAQVNSPMNYWAYLGAGLWVIGFLFETIGDWQLLQFRLNPENHGKVLDKGLWAWTRHPNYFGDACVWWGLWLISFNWSYIFAPALMTYFLLKWSGVPLLEKGLSKSRKGYDKYQNRVSAFFPQPPFASFSKDKNNHTDT